jgi:hypothetical protein
MVITAAIMAGTITAIIDATSLTPSALSGQKTSGL